VVCKWLHDQAITDKETSFMEGTFQTINNFTKVLHLQSIIIGMVVWVLLTLLVVVVVNLAIVYHN
jgi:hypothetical protein